MLFELNYITALKAPKEHLIYNTHWIKLFMGSSTSLHRDTVILGYGRSGGLRHVFVLFPNLNKGNVPF